MVPALWIPLSPYLFFLSVYLYYGPYLHQKTVHRLSYSIKLAIESSNTAPNSNTIIWRKIMLFISINKGIREQFLIDEQQS